MFVWWCGLLPRADVMRREGNGGADKKELKGRKEMEARLTAPALASALKSLWPILSQYSVFAGVDDREFLVMVGPW